MFATVVGDEFVVFCVSHHKRKPGLLGQLAAKVEIALRGMRLFDSFGAWRGVVLEQQETEPDEERAPERCACCGAEHPRCRVVVMPRDRWLQIATTDRKPRLSRSGIDPPLRADAGLPPPDPERPSDASPLRRSHRWQHRFRQWQAAAADAEQRARLAVGLTGDKAA